MIMLLYKHQELISEENENKAILQRTEKIVKDHISHICDPEKLNDINLPLNKELWFISDWLRYQINNEGGFVLQVRIYNIWVRELMGCVVKDPMLIKIARNSNDYD